MAKVAHQQLQGLTELQLKISYSSDSGNLVKDFYVPCLSRSQLYRRAVGYFTSQGLALAAQGVAHLLKNGGKIRLVASPCLDEKDIEAIHTGYKQREDILKEVTSRTFEQIEDNITKDRLNALAWLISSHSMDIRLALRVDANGRLKRGIFHEKMGIFTDSHNNSVAFSGSPNETAGGLVENFESIDVFWAWDDPFGRVAKKIERFERLWENATEGLEVINFTAATEELLSHYKKERPPSHDPLEIKLPISTVRKSVSLWHHQKKAVEQFLHHKRGILEMATGTGKTHASLSILNSLITKGAIQSVIVTCDGTDLLRQWSRELLSSLPNTEPRFRLLRHFADYHDRDEFVLSPTESVLLCSRGSLAPVMKSLPQTIRESMLVVFDEVHGMGSDSHVQSLDGLFDNVPYRLGLSATPERFYDQEGNLFIENNIGPIIFEFGLEDAIRKGILCQFDYYPIHWRPDDDDRNRLQTVYKKKSAREAAGNPMSEAEIWTELARVYKISPVKAPLFVDFLRKHPEILDRCIIFVAEKRYGELVFEHIHRITHEFHTYFDSDDRSVLMDFASSKIQCLITCHRLSEGIDIRSVKSIVLLSSDKSPLETIQRIGRCLRTDPSNLDKRAVVIDFIRLADPDSKDVTGDQAREEWLRHLSQVTRGGKLNA